MTTDELLSYHVRTTNAALELMSRKNHDYAGDSGNTPFLNFQQCENLRLCSTAAGLLVRMSDKLTRLACFTSSGTLQVVDEKIEDTVHDLINYSILFAAYVTQETKQS